MRIAAFKLARMCGRLDVDNMTAEISTNLFTEWIAFHDLYPMEDDHICDYIRQLTHYVCVQAGIKKDPDDLVIRYGETSMERMRRKFSKMMKGMGRIIKGAK